MTALRDSSSLKRGRAPEGPRRCDECVMKSAWRS